jgi:periplasmic divalent cation tolerance protein
MRSYDEPMQPRAQPNDAGDARVVLVTHPRAGAREFARRLVERRLAACVNLADVRSVYRWEGAVEDEEEALLVVKTTAGRLAELEATLADEHPYDVPECVALAPAHVEPRYLAWLTGEVAPAAPADPAGDA